MKKTLYKIGAAILGFITIALLMFRGSNSSAPTDIAVNKTKIDDVKDKSNTAIKDKEHTKKKIEETNSEIKNTINQKKSTESAKKIAKDFADKYKS